MKIPYGLPYHLAYLPTPPASCKHIDANVFVTPDALLNEAFATHVLQLVST